MAEPGLNEDRLFKKVGALVESRTGGQQRPWREGSLRGDFIFNAPVTVKVELAAVNPSVKIGNRAIELTFWDSIKDSDDPAMFDAYLTKFPRGEFASIAELKRDRLPKATDAVAPTQPPRPLPVAAAQTVNQQKIAALLSAAKKDVEALRLTSPKGNNAVERYRAVLGLDADNAAAVAGLGDVVGKYVRLAE